MEHDTGTGVVKFFDSEGNLTRTRRLSEGKRAWITQDRFAEKYYHLSPYSYAAGNPIRYIDINGDSINVAQEYQEQFMNDMRNVYGDNVNLFSFNKSGNLTFSGKPKDLTKEQKAIYKGMNGLMSSKTEYGVTYQDTYTAKDGTTIDVIADAGGAMFYAKDNKIVISPNISTVEVFSVEMGHPSFMHNIIIQQNTTSGVFHELGEAALGTNPNRTGAVKYENKVRAIIGLPYRPMDASHPTGVFK